MLFQIELRLYNLYQTNLLHFKPLHWRDYPKECFYFLILLIVGWSYKPPFSHPSQGLLVIQASVFSSFSSFAGNTSVSFLILLSFAGHTSIRFLILLIVCWSYKRPFSHPSYRLLVIQASVFSSFLWFASHTSIRFLVLLMVCWSYKHPFSHPSHRLLVIQASVFSSLSFAGPTTVRFLVLLIVCW